MEKDTISEIHLVIKSDIEAWNPWIFKGVPAILKTPPRTPAGNTDKTVLTPRVFRS